METLPSDFMGGRSLPSDFMGGISAFRFYGLNLYLQILWVESLPSDFMGQIFTFRFYGWKFYHCNTENSLTHEISPAMGGCIQGS